MAANYPAGFVEEVITSAVPLPTAMAFAPDGRLFVCEKGPGNASGDAGVRVIKNGALLAVSFVTVTVDSRQDRGLVGIAFDPQFATSRFVYVYYTSPAPTIHNRIVRFTADASNPDVAAAGSATPILELDDLGVPMTHNGGALHFGPDGKLYAGCGDIGTPSNSQSLENLSGKILRLEPDGTVPVDNPYYNQAPRRAEIWANGLRNPFTFAFQPVSGRMHINDVGQNTREEIDLGARGANYGWPECEGPCSPPEPEFTEPIASYNHDINPPTYGAAIAGGAFYTASGYPPACNGAYFFGDHIVGFIKVLDASNVVHDFATNVNSPVDIELGPDGNLYYSSILTNSILRIRYTAPVGAGPGVTPALSTAVTQTLCQ